MVRVSHWKYAEKPSPFKEGTVNGDIHDMLTAISKKTGGVVDKWTAQKVIKKAKEQGVISSKRDSLPLLEDYLTQIKRHDILIPVRDPGE